MIEKIRRNDWPHWSPLWPLPPSFLDQTTIFRMFIFMTKNSQLSRSLNVCLVAVLSYFVIMIVGHGEGPRGLKYSIYCGRKISFIFPKQTKLWWRPAADNTIPLWWLGCWSTNIYLNQLSSLLSHNCDCYSYYNCNLIVCRPAQSHSPNYPAALHVSLTVSHSIQSKVQSQIFHSPVLLFCFRKTQLNNYS